LRENAVFAVALIGLGGYFLYDGMLGYPSQNEAYQQEQAEEKEKNPNLEIDGNPKHSDAEIAIQKMLAGLCGAGAIYMIVAALRARRTRVVVDDEGLRINTRPMIPYDAMTALRSDRWKDKGWVDLTYDDGGRTRQVRLDSYRIEPCEPLITAICERKGFTNPIPPETEPPPDR